MVIKIKPGGLYEKALRSTEAVYTDKVIDYINEVLPSGLRKFNQKIAEIVGIQESIFIALTVADKPFGLLTISGKSLAETDLAVVRTFANQAAIALENAFLFNQINTARHQLTRLSHQLVEAQENERRRVARELHDEIGQLLTAMNISLESTTKQVEDAAIAKKLNDNLGFTKELMSRISKLSLALRPTVLDDLGLAPALTSLVQRLQSTTELQIDLTMSDLTGKRFSPELEISVYRIVQESLTNVIRHAKTKRVKIDLSLQKEKIILMIKDEGKGFDVERALALNESSGILGMKERAELLGGTLLLETKPGQGAQISASLPLKGHKG